MTAPEPKLVKQNDGTFNPNLIFGHSSIDAECQTEEEGAMLSAVQMTGTVRVSRDSRNNLVAVTTEDAGGGEPWLHSEAFAWDPLPVTKKTLDKVRWVPDEMRCSRCENPRGSRRATEPCAARAQCPWPHARALALSGPHLTPGAQRGRERCGGRHAHAMFPGPVASGVLQYRGQLRRRIRRCGCPA